MADIVPGIMMLKRSKVAPRVVVCGDPARAKELAERFLSNVETVSQIREYHTYTGTYNGVPITVASHGVGASGASMAFHELIQAGAKLIVRLGTCGSFVDDLREGSYLIAAAAVRADGTSDGLVPASYPAFASPDVVLALERAVQGTTHRTGVILTEGKFYDGPIGNRNEFWAGCGVIGVEMEAACLFVQASLAGIKAGAICNVDNVVIERLQEGAYHPRKDVVLQATRALGGYVFAGVSAIEV